MTRSDTSIILCGKFPTVYGKFDWLSMVWEVEGRRFQRATSSAFVDCRAKASDVPNLPAPKMQTFLVNGLIIAKRPFWCVRLFCRVGDTTNWSKGQKRKFYNLKWCMGYNRWLRTRFMKSLWIHKLIESV